MYKKGDNGLSEEFFFFFFFFKKKQILGTFEKTILIRLSVYARVGPIPTSPLIAMCSI